MLICKDKATADLQSTFYFVGSIPEVGCGMHLVSPTFLWSELFSTLLPDCPTHTFIEMKANVS